LNLISTRAWPLKEAFREFRKIDDEEEAAWYLQQRFSMAAHSRLKPMKRMGKMIPAHWNGILVGFRHRITCGVIKALNNTAKASGHRARGYRTVRIFTNVMMRCMGGLEMPELFHRFSLGAMPELHHTFS
jgi:transposase